MMSDRPGMFGRMLHYASGYRESFAGKLFISVAAIALLIFCLIFAFDYWSETRTMRQNISNKGRLLSSILAKNARTGVFAENQDMLRAACESITQSSDVLAIRISDINDRLLYEYKKDGISEDEFKGLPAGRDMKALQDRGEKIFMIPGKKVYLFSAPIIIERAYQAEGLFYSDAGDAAMQKDLIGYLYLGLNRAYHEKRLKTVLITDVTVAALILLLAGSLIFWLARKMTRPLVSLAEAVRSFGKGQQFSAVTVNSRDEVGKLAEAFSAMTDSLQHKEAERQRMESQFRQAQKMDAVGTLAGGIAHDFNNIPSAIIGFANIMKIGMEKDDPAMGQVDHILSASARGTSLVQSLLAFSRQRIIDPKPVSVSEIITSMEKILKRLIREDIAFRIELSEEDLVVMADAGQIDQALMNLCTNARDAMPDGGVLTLATRRARLEENFFRDYGTARPGMYAVISVADTGLGMNKETLKKIFDPFFTTKEVGKGSGLGLSTVYGIVKQHGGYLDVVSEEGEGTAFNMYFPLLQTSVEKEKEKKAALLTKGTETILVAEDDEDVRIYITDILTIFGYKVIAVTNGDEAVDAFVANQGIDLLLLDVVMPRKNGREALEAIRQTAPDIKILFLSGYPAEAIGKKGIIDKGLNYISKPVTPEALLPKLREILDHKPY
ncbi:MAG: response regulator [Nitrospirae bacterium]|nr:response regulator [Nitrospirota bacterium]